MPGKMARSARRPPFGASTLMAVVRAARLPCRNEEKAQKTTQNREYLIGLLSWSQWRTAIAKI
jgi:hypothetical protein